MNKDPNCIFCKIVDGAIPSNKLHEDEDVLHSTTCAAGAGAFPVIPKEHVATLYDAGMAQHRALGKMLALVGELPARRRADGFRTSSTRAEWGIRRCMRTCTCLGAGPLAP
jgi:histidine triad (HIT) family protein